MKTAVELLFERLWNTDKDELTWYAMFEAAKEMEKKTDIFGFKPISKRCI